MIAGLKKRGFTEERLENIDKVLALDDIRKEVQTQLDTLLNERNTLSDEIGNLFKQGKGQEANQLKARVQTIKEAADALEIKLQETKADLDALLVAYPISLIAVSRKGKHRRIIRSTKPGTKHSLLFLKEHYHTGNWLRNTILSTLSWEHLSQAVDFHCIEVKVPGYKEH